MKSIRTGLTTENSTSLLHEFLYVKGAESLSVDGFELNNAQFSERQLGKPHFSFHSKSSLYLQPKSDAIAITDSVGHVRLASVLIIKPESRSQKMSVSNNQQFLNERIYKGNLLVIAQKNKMRVILQTSLEDYVRGVLKGEMPATYHLEAIKAQAVCARTYALHPRVNHQKDLCDVCDSFLCCQAFSGWQADINPVYYQASDETMAEVLTYKDQPILALFSACSGGHTENYEDCFSDWDSGRFPPPPLPYLKGIAESTEAIFTDKAISEEALKKLWFNKTVSTFDSWSPQFRWSLNLLAEDIESNMHHTLSQLLAKKEFAPFVTGPSSGLFGDVRRFYINKRGIGGTAIELTVSTSKGDWQLKKELTIRSLFKNKKTNFDRLLSAKIVFDQLSDNNQQLQSIVIRGLGHGHGVGMQQVGAQGMAKRGNNYKQILAHYYCNVRIETVQ
jgi:SpoIID/LytB domain protein